MQAGSLLLLAISLLFFYLPLCTHNMCWISCYKSKRVDDIGHFDLCRQLLNFQLISRSKTIDFVYSSFSLFLFIT